MNFKTIMPLFLLILISSLGCSQGNNNKSMKFKELTPDEGKSDHL